MPRIAWIPLIALALAVPALSEPAPKIEPEVIVEGLFRFAEGLAFNGEGHLFMVANRTIWEIRPDGSARKVTEVLSNLGLAPVGERDLLMADFGPTAAPQVGVNDDGIVWRVTPEGEKTRLAEGIGDPNALVVLPSGEVLVTDDFTHHIYRVAPTGEVSVFSDRIPFPNGIVLARDASALYVTQLFRREPVGPPPARYTEFSDAVWRLPLEDLRPAGPPEVIFRTGGETGPDGLAMDSEGRLYLSAAREGQLWRIDPKNGQGELLAEGLPGLASLAFGRGEFDGESLYATQIRGGRLLRFPVGARGAPLHPGPSP